MEDFIVGFNARLDKIAEVKLTEKVKGHMMLRQAGLDPHERQLIVASAAGHFELRTISAALRASYRNRDQNAPTGPSSNQSTRMPPAPSSHTQYRQSSGSLSNNLTEVHAAPSSHVQYRQPQPRLQETETRTDNRHERQSQTHRMQPLSSDDPIEQAPNFLFPRFRQEPGSKSRAILDTGACASIVGKDTLDAFMAHLQLARLPNTKLTMKDHRFGDHNDKHPTLFAVKVPFYESQDGWSTGKAPAFRISFDVISGKLPFLIGLPSLTSMNASINFAYSNLNLRLSGISRRFELERCSNHIYLPYALRENSFSSGSRS